MRHGGRPLETRFFYISLRLLRKEDWVLHKLVKGVQVEQIVHWRLVHGTMEWHKKNCAIRRGSTPFDDGLDRFVPQPIVDSVSSQITCFATKHVICLSGRVKQCDVVIGRFLFRRVTADKYRLLNSDGEFNRCLYC